MSRTTEEQISGLLRNAQENIKDAYDKGYKSGLKDGNINDGTFAVKVKEAYNNGLNDTEKAVRRIIACINDGGLTPREKQMIFGLSQDYVILTNFSMSEIIKKIQEYDERKQQEKSARASGNEIHIGDEIYIIDKNHRAVVTALLDNGNKANLLCESGKYYIAKTSILHKTGGTYAIADILEGLGNDRD